MLADEGLNPVLDLYTLGKSISKNLKHKMCLWLRHGEIISAAVSRLAVEKCLQS